MIKFNSPDLNAPRFRAKYKKILTKELYKEFKEKYPNYDITYETFKKIILKFHNNICDKALKSRTGVELLEGLGIILIGAFKPSGPNIDFNSSVKYGVAVKHRNLNTNGLACKIFYTNYNVKYKLKNRSFWKFKPHKKFKRLVSKEFQDNFNRYIIVDNKTNVSNLFAKK